MATKRKSIIEEALLEAKTLEDALKANTKEMLATHMKQEIENIVETSLKEDVDNEGSDENELPVEIEDIIDIEDAGDGSELEGEESEFLDLDDEEDEEELALTVSDDDLPIDIELGDPDELDLTASSDEEVLTVFKAMSDEDEVEVVKDEIGIHLTDNETGAEYYIKESEQLEEDDLCEGCGNHVDEDDEVVYEIELDERQKSGGNKGNLSRSHRDYEDVDETYGGNEDDLSRSHRDYVDEHQGTDAEEDESLGMRRGPKRRYRQGEKARREDSYGKWGERGIEHRDISLEEEELEEDRTMNNRPKTGRVLRAGGKAPYGYGAYSESRKSRRPISNKRKEARNVGKVNDSKIMKEYKELKSKNEEYKGALKVFKDKLNEVALFNTNLAYVNRLFTEHSTTKKEKMGILKRFDGAEGVKESKNIYKSIKGELDGKTPITESVENRVNKIVKSSSSDLNESTAYVDPQIVAIKDLMKRIS